MEDSWAAVADELLEQAAAAIQAATEAEEIRSTSSDRTHPSQQQPWQPWWARVVKNLTPAHLLPKLEAPLKVISGCTGCGAETETLKARFFVSSPC